MPAKALRYGSGPLGRLWQTVCLQPCGQRQNNSQAKMEKVMQARKEVTAAWAWPKLPDGVYFARIVTPRFMYGQLVMKDPALPP